MRRKSRSIRRGTSALLTAGMLLAGASGAANAATVYTAGDDDTFWKLSQKFGVPLDKLMVANADIDPLNLYKGLKLVIPDAAGTNDAGTSAAAGTLPNGVQGTANAATVYTAGDDDTFWKLSQKFGVPLDKLMAANAHIDPLNIYKGLTLVIPDAGSGGAITGPATAPATSGASGAAATGTSGSASTASSVFAAGQAGETPKTYKSAFQVKATAYTASAEENGIWGPVDYFGNPLSLGTVAVDPDVIPLGSKLYIAGYDYAGLPKGGMYAIATDTGGAIKGKRIDIFVPDSRAEALKFGIQSVTVYVLQ